jgi:hypothetical protein
VKRILLEHVSGITIALIPLIYFVPIRFKTNGITGDNAVG